MSVENLNEGSDLKVQDLKPYSRKVNLTVKVVSKGEEREVVSRADGSRHRVSDFLVGDETGVIYMTMWDENIDRVNEGDTVSIKNGYVTLFRGSMRLNLGRYGSLEEANESLGDVNTENNLSDKRFEQRPRFRPVFRDTGYRGRGHRRRR